MISPNEGKVLCSLAGLNTHTYTRTLEHIQFSRVQSALEFYAPMFLSIFFSNKVTS